MFNGSEDKNSPEFLSVNNNSNSENLILEKDAQAIKLSTNEPIVAEGQSNGSITQCYVGDSVSSGNRCDSPDYLNYNVIGCTKKRKQRPSFGGSKRKGIPKKTKITTPMEFRPPQKKLNLCIGEGGDDVHTSIPGLLRRPGYLYMFGQGDAGQLGLGENVEEANIPTLVKFKYPALKFIKVACGGMHTILLSTEGRVYSCGCNDEGALGRSISNVSEYEFMEVKFPKNVKISAIVAGDSFSAALTTTGVVYAWGVFRDCQGPIGLIKYKECQNTPAIIYDDIEHPCIQISGGNNHLMILSQQGRVFSCGCGDDGQLGRVSERTVMSRGGRYGLKIFLKPIEVVLPNKFKDSLKRSSKHDGVAEIVYAGKCNTFVRMKNSALMGWGLNGFRQISQKNGNQIFFPIFLDEVEHQTNISLTNEVHISAGIGHTMIYYRPHGSVYTLGDNSFCQLGRNTQNKSFQENPENWIHPLNMSLNICAMSCGDTCSFIVDKNNLALFSWGMGISNQLGVGHDKDVDEPVCVDTKSLEHPYVLQ
ncbi:hypothetical protein HZS_3993, partial [Henneguya salminicola]